MRGKQFGKILALCTGALLLLSSCKNLPAGPNSSGTATPPPPAKATRPVKFIDKHSDGKPVFSYDAAINGDAPADRPAAPGDAYAPPAADAPDGTPVIISGVTVQADPDDSVIIEGAGFAKDGAGQKVLVYAQTADGNGREYEAKVLAADETTVTAVMPGEAGYSAYRVRVENGAGKSKPVYVNLPSLWWMSETNARPGDTISVYGHNLSTENGGGMSYIYLHLGGEKAEDQSVRAEVLEATPYMVSFKIPDGLKTGYQYEVWLHNGHGGDLGWVYAPQYLTVTNVPGLEWRGRTIKVTDYGAKPNDGADDTKEIEKAVADAQAGDTILFPAGTYHVSDEIRINKESVRLLGEGRDASVIDTSRNAKTATFNISTTPLEVRGLGFRDSRSDPHPPNFLYLRGDGYDTGTPNIVIEECYFEMDNTTENMAYGVAMQIGSVQNVYVRNNEFLAPATIYGGNMQKVFYNNNRCVGNFMNGAADGPQQVHLKDVSRIDISKNTILGLDKLTDPDGQLEANNRCVNRSIVFHGMATELYVAKNDISRTGSPIDNSGEQIMFEAPYTNYMGKATAIEGDTVTFDDATFASPGKEAVVTVVNGRGQAQSRTVVNITGKTLTIDKPWSVQPDKTSLFTVTRPFMNAVVYANKIDGEQDYTKAYSAGCGIQMYGNMRNFFVKDNRFSNYNQGILITSHYQPPGYGAEMINNQAMWSIVDNNTMNDVRRGILAFLVFDYAPDKPKETQPLLHTVMNTVIRRNTVTKTRLSQTDIMEGLGGDGIMAGSISVNFVNRPETNTWPGDWVRGTLIEHNAVSDTARDAISIFKHSGMTVIRDNTFKNIGGSDIGYDKHKVGAILANSGSR